VPVEVVAVSTLGAAAVPVSLARSAVCLRCLPCWAAIVFAMTHLYSVRLLSTLLPSQLSPNSRGESGELLR
jgi:hypothetical protein